MTAPEFFNEELPGALGEKEKEIFALYVEAGAHPYYLNQLRFQLHRYGRVLNSAEAEKFLVERLDE